MSANHRLVTVDTDHEGRQFMNCHKPERVEVTIQSDGSVVVNINDTCVFRVGSPKVVTLTNRFDGITITTP